MKTLKECGNITLSHPYKDIEADYKLLLGFSFMVHGNADNILESAYVSLFWTLSCMQRDA
jgi:hypothetical protein